MANIDHVNRYFWLRLLFIPLVALNYSIKRFKLKRSSKNYLIGALDDSEEKRYSSFLSFFEKQLFLKNLVYSFCFKKKVAKQQIIFVVNETLDWDSIGLMNYIIKYQKHPYPKFLLNDLLIDSKQKKLPIFWDFIDTFYGEKDLDRALLTNRSFLVEKSFLERHPSVIDKIKISHIPIMPIYCARKQNGKKIWYVSGDLIKTSGLALFKSNALLETIDSVFVKLEKNFLDIDSKSEKNNT